MRLDLLVGLALVFIPVSLTSIGGGAATVAGIQNETVNIHAWVDSNEFVNLFAISRASPGPGMMLATVIGWKVAGWLGATVATLALFIPSSLLCYALVTLTNSHREKKWHRAMRDGLAPVGVGLIIAGVITIFRISEGGLFSVVIAGLSAAILFWCPRFPILVVLILGGAVAAATSELPAALSIF